MIRTFGLLVVLCLAVSCVDRHGLIEAIFRLRDDSPLPSWVVLPQGTTRDQVSVTIISYESASTSQGKVQFVIRDKRRWIFNTIQEQMGYAYRHPDSVERNIYPYWVIVEVNGTKEVYEHSERGDLLCIVKKPLN